MSDDKTIFENDILPFVRKKNYLFKKWLTPGGTGDTVLIYDESIDEYFVCKKFAPKQREYTDELFSNFVQEVKILYKVFHKNIVRVYNHFLYINEKSGFIIMEYIDGEDIDKYLGANPDKINEVFLQVVDGFWHLEQIQVLHRDIRTGNILVSTKDNTVKIIDFGFGKKIENNEDFKTKLLLNWTQSELPSEISDDTYCVATDLYFIGKLFYKIINQTSNSYFKFSDIIEKMIKIDFSERIQSFHTIKQLMNTDLIIPVKKDEKEIYNSLANYLAESISKLYQKPIFDFDDESVIAKLNDLLKKVRWEDCISSIDLFVKCFFVEINCEYESYVYNYYGERDEAFTIDIDVVQNFFTMFKSLSADERKNLLENLYFNRIANMQIAKETIEAIDGDEFPF
ncbi:MAG TPA: serine/threonine protein kinase [Desulfotomaculum sp.]|nr:serine/threonine protein kinase [Desulfotomaculum sp.]